MVQGGPKMGGWFKSPHRYTFSMYSTTHGVYRNWASVYIYAWWGSRILYKPECYTGKTFSKCCCRYQLFYLIFLIGCLLCSIPQKSKLHATCVNELMQNV